MSTFGSEIGSGLGEPGGTRPPRIPRNTKYPPRGPKPESRKRQAFKVTTARTCFLASNWFFREKVSFIDKLMQLRSQVLSPTRGETLVRSGHVSPRIWEITNKLSLSLRMDW